MKKTLKIIFLVLLLFFSAIFVYYIFQDKNRDKTKDEAEKILNNLTLEQKIGQLFIIGIEGKILDRDTEDLIKKIHPGGILLLDKNIGNENQLKELIAGFQKIAIEDTGIPLFIAVDQEGGLISRIDWIEKTPQSEIKDSVDAHNIGKERGKSLKELGINLNLAPLLDVSYPQDFIFKRSFNKNSEKIGQLGRELVGGQKDSGIMVTVKHFPGYGGINFNPEDRLAVLNKTPEFSQFQTVVEAKPEMIMVSDVIYNDIDPKLPFTFSEKAIDFLKEKIPGNYLIISDDLDQYSLLNNFSLTDIVSLPIKAGVDIIIFSGWRGKVEKGPESLKIAIEQKKITEKEIDNAVLKIIKLKEKLK